MITIEIIIKPFIFVEMLPYFSMKGLLNKIDELVSIVFPAVAVFIDQTNRIALLSMSKINIALKQERDQILNKSLYLTLDIRISEFMDVSFKLQL